MTYTRTSTFIKIEANGVNPEGKRLNISVTSEIKADKLDPAGLRGSDLAEEITHNISLISEQIEIDMDTLAVSKTHSTKPIRKLIKELKKDELDTFLEDNTSDIPETVKKKPKKSPFAM
jgi:hypothetical protein